MPNKRTKIEILLPLIKDLKTVNLVFLFKNKLRLCSTLNCRATFYIKLSCFFNLYQSVSQFNLDIEIYQDKWTNEDFLQLYNNGVYCITYK